MDKDHGNTNFVDRVTEFAMKQTSRRGFMKQVGEGALVFTGTFGSLFGLSGFRLLPLLPLACPPECKGICSCNQISTCITGGKRCSCHVGDCSTGLYIQAVLDHLSDCSPLCLCIEGCNH